MKSPIDKVRVGRKAGDNKAGDNKAGDNKVRDNKAGDSKAGRRGGADREREGSGRSAGDSRADGRGVGAIRWGAVALVLVSLLALLAATRRTPEAYLPVLEADRVLWMPSATDSNALTETWFCPGMPATAEDEGSAFRITNRWSDPSTGTILLYNEASQNVRIDLEVAPFSIQEVDTAQLPGEITGAVVEVEGGGVLVEQVSSTPNGNSISNCANDTNTNWYFADGFTVDGSRDRIVLSNPYDQPVVVELDFAVEDGTRNQAAYNTMPIPARSIRVIDLGTAGGGAQDEPLLAVSVTATRGQLVVGRVQDYASGGRAGVQVSVGSPYLSDQWRFAGGRNNDNNVERYTIYNPTEDEVLVEPIILGNASVSSPEEGELPADLTSIEVGPGKVVEFLPSEITNFPTGDYAMVFSTLSEPTIVVERATTQTLDGVSNTSVILGATSRAADDYLATQWLVPAAPEDGLGDALVLHNIDLQAGTFTVYAVGPEGPQAVSSMTDLPLPGATEVLRVDLDDPAVVGRPLVVQTTNRVLVERWYRSGRGKTRSVAWAFPAG